MCFIKKKVKLHKNVYEWIRNIWKATIMRFLVTIDRTAKLSAVAALES